MSVTDPAGPVLGRPGPFTAGAVEPADQCRQIHAQGRADSPSPLQRVGSQVEMSVTDTGRGIAPEFVDTCSSGFGRPTDRLTREHGGLGLGLAIVKQLVELQGGTVKAEQRRGRTGRAFTVRLPADGGAARCGQIRPAPIRRAIAPAR